MDHPTDMLGILYSPVLRLMRLFTRTTPPALHVARPTSTTVAFTVMTRPPAITLSQKLQLYFWYLLRTCLGVFILSLLWAKGRMCYPLPLEDGLEQLLWESRVGWGLRSAVKAVDVRLLVAFGVLGLWAVVRRGYTEESLLVLSGLGIQTSSSSPTYLSTATTRFIPTASIQDIFIHEAFKGFEVKFYLTFVVEGEEDAVVVFPKLLPSRVILEEVWRGAKACLYEPKS
ncbi:phosphatidylinositol N-acetylglucosaminyltransferase [Phyllosticta capitalensis]|uniref:Phosphatidylinositol N-acetylglucosaminyltransferase n=1 Tax=Phyllosticta capitalensis TaxID=121624 RepID=A0ABR1YLB6_9PEZI